MESPEKIIGAFRDHLKKTAEAVRSEIGKVRTGRANVGIVDHVRVDAYGSPMPLNQVAALSTPDPRQIVIQPWDTSLIGAIENAILTSDLGLTPSNDGKIIRLVLPQMTEERRKELAKQVRKLGEDGKVVVRQHRKHANEAIKKLEKEKLFSEDEGRRHETQIQKMTDEAVTQLDQMVAQKEKELLTI